MIITAQQRRNDRRMMKNKRVFIYGTDEIRNFAFTKLEAGTTKPQQETCNFADMIKNGEF